MTYIRHITAKIREHVQTRKEALILTGPRQVGKTKLLTSLFPHALYLSCDDASVKKLLDSHSVSVYQQNFSEKGIIILDEVQYLADPGRTGKLMFDHFSNIKLIITGSAGLTIKNKHTESMAGRAIDYQLYPLTLSEYLTQNETTGESLNFHTWDHLFSPPPATTHLFDQDLLYERILRFGLYPSLIGDPDPAVYLTNLVKRIIFHDLLDLKLIDQQHAAIQLLTLLAHQIGQIVSIAELSILSGMDQRTVARYLTLFEESYLIYRLYPYSRRERDVLSKRPKIYFYDTGVRNALIGNFSPLDHRLDTGHLFENFVIMEAVKAKAYLNDSAKLYFWKTKQGAEIDLVLSQNESVTGVEIKWDRGHITSGFVARYPHAKAHLITRHNLY